jgi:hypothetical protein
MTIHCGPRWYSIVDGSVNHPFASPMQAQVLSVASGNYYFKSKYMASPELLSFQPRYYENLPFCCVFRSTVQTAATTNKIDLYIPMRRLLVQRDTLDIRAAVYPTYVNSHYGTTSTDIEIGTGIFVNNGWDFKIMLGQAGGHGIYNSSQEPCNLVSSTGSIGAGYNGTTCGSFPDNLLHGTGTNNAVYDNISGTWSHWVYWQGVQL